LRDPSEQLAGGVYQFSRNVAIKIVEIALTKNILPPLTWRPTAINLLILQPAAKSLQDQTVNRLSEFLTNGGLGQTSQLRTTTDIVVNSSSVPTSKAAEEFREKLSNPTYLHLLILDEFDWGASKGSQLNEYLKQVVADRQTQLEENQECRLLFLPISATPEMLLAPDDEYNNYKVSLVDLAATGSIFFATPTYRSIYDLDYQLHEPQHKKLEDQSAAIKLEYLGAMERFANDQPGLGTPADEVIRHLAANPTHTALVRLGRTNDVEDLKRAHSQLIGRQFEFHDGENSSTFENLTGLLAVVQRCQRGDTISKHCRFYDVRSRYVREAILQLSTFKQDVGRCAGHGKDRAKVFNCLFSAPGSGDKFEMSRPNLDKRCRRLHGTLGTQKTKLKPHPDSEEIEAREEAYKPVFRTLRNSESTVLLCAEPQIGKTGAFLSLLRLLHELYFPVAATTTEPCRDEPTTESSSEVARIESAINDKTRQLYFLGREGLIQEMAKPEVFSSYHDDMRRLNRSWDERHVSPLFQIVGYIRQKIVERLEEGDTSFTVVDAGSGTCQLALALHDATAEFNKARGKAKARATATEEEEEEEEEEDPNGEQETECEDWDISVVALDAPTPDDWREKLPASKKSEYDTLLATPRLHGVKLSYHGGDYAESSRELADGTVDFLLFSLSFSSGDDIWREIRMARRLLKKRRGRATGTLYIADMAHRFKPEVSFEEKMTQAGFVRRGPCQPLSLFKSEVLLFTFGRQTVGKDPDSFLIEPKYTASLAVGPAAVLPPAVAE